MKQVLKISFIYDSCQVYQRFSLRCQRNWTNLNNTLLLPRLQLKPLKLSKYKVLHISSTIKSIRNRLFNYKKRMKNCVLLLIKVRQTKRKIQLKQTKLWHELLDKFKRFILYLQFWDYVTHSRKCTRNRCKYCIGQLTFDCDFKVI